MLSSRNWEEQPSRFVVGFDRFVQKSLYRESISFDEK
jgi:hypothetical protein